MSKFFTALLLVLTGGIVYAQTGNTVSYHELELTGKNINLLANPLFLTEVIDATGTENKPIGTAHKGLSNRPSQIVFQGGLRNAFNDMLAKTPQDRQHQNAKIRITGITDNEFIGNAEVRKVEMEAELAVGDGTGNQIYGPLRYVDMYVGLDVTSGHAQAVVTSFDTLVHRLTRRYQQGAYSRTIPATEINHANTDFAINTNDFAEIPDGFYETFMDFRAAAPSIAIEPDIRRELEPFTDEDSRVFSILTFKKPKGIKAKEFNGYWGAHIAGKPYMKIQDHYFEIRRDDSLGLAVALPSEIYRQTANGATIAASAMFGIAGGLLAALIVNNNKDYELYSFSPRSGLVTSRREFNRTESVTGVLLSSSAFSNKKITLHVSTAGGKQKLLVPGQHLLLGDVTEICFTIEGEQTECQPVEPSSAPQILYQLLIKSNGKYRLELMPDADAAELSASIMAGKR